MHCDGQPRAGICDAAQDFGDSSAAVRAWIEGYEVRGKKSIKRGDEPIAASYVDADQRHTALLRDRMHATCKVELLWGEVAGGDIAEDFCVGALPIRESAVPQTPLALLHH
jgi:hypothetical protein